MKSIFLVLLIILYGCAETPTTSTLTTTPTAWSKATSFEKTDERKLNEKCQADIEEVEIFQVLDDGALANVCERPNMCYGMIVAVAKVRGEELWDKKRIKASKDKCMVINGTYKYTSTDERSRTVPIVGLDYRYQAVDEKEIVERMNAALELEYGECLDESMKEPNADRSLKTKMCGCFIDTMKNFASEIRSGSEIVEPDTFIEKWIKQSEKKCGKSPKNMQWFK